MIPLLTAVNFRPAPRPECTCRTTALARICPSWTRKSSLTFAPTPPGSRVSINRPPSPRFQTREVSPSQPHYTHTPSGVFARHASLNGKLVAGSFLTMPRGRQALLHHK